MSLRCVGLAQPRVFTSQKTDANGCAAACVGRCCICGVLAQGLLNAASMKTCARVALLFFVVGCQPGLPANEPDARAVAADGAAGALPLPPGPAHVDVEACEFASNASSPHLQLWNQAWRMCVNLSVTPLCDASRMICQSVPYRINRAVWVLGEGRKHNSTTERNLTWLHSHHNWTDRIVLQDGLHTVELEDRTFIDEQGQRVKWLMTIKQGASVLASGIEMLEYEVSP